MNSLQILSLKVDVFFGHLQRSVPQNFHEHELGPTAPDIVCSKSVPKGMYRPRWRIKAKAPTQDFEIPQYDVTVELGTLPRREHQVLRLPRLDVFSACEKLPGRAFLKLTTLGHGSSSSLVDY